MMDPFIANVSSSLLSAIWQGVILAGFIALCLRLIPALSSAIRSLVWSTVFCAICVLHLLPPRAEAIATQAIHVPAQWSVAVGFLWLSCSIVRALQLLVGLRYLRRVLRRATLLTLNLQMPVSPRAYKVYESPDVDRPSVLGFFSPRVLLPRGLAETLTKAELNQILLHEVEHLRRADDWTNLAQRLALIVFPLNPVLIWVERRMCAERELACDDAVVSTTGARKAYALCLTQLAERTMMRRGLALALGAWERRSELASRVHRILSRPARPSSSAAPRATVCSLVCAVALGSGMLARLPRLFTFVPAASSVQIADAGRQSSLTAPPAVFTNAAFHPANGHASLVWGKQSARFARGTRSHHSGPRRSNHPSPPVLTADKLLSLPVSGGDMLLTTSSSDAATELYVPAVILVPVTYAAVPTADGWILIQL